MTQSSQKGAVRVKRSLYYVGVNADASRLLGQVATSRRYCNIVPKGAVNLDLWCHEGMQAGSWATILHSLAVNLGRTTASSPARNGAEDTTSRVEHMQYKAHASGWFQAEGHTCAQASACLCMQRGSGEGFWTGGCTTAHDAAKTP
jgi:hypothetical protein